MARFAFEALGIELTEGQPDTSANNANEKKSRTMKKLIGGGLAAATATGALLLGAAPAHADGFLSCGAGAGIASSVTSCEFAANVRYAWFHQPGRVIEAYSPVTGMYYTMYCDPNYTARMDTGRVYNSVHCEGGNDAVVVIW